MFNFAQNLVNQGISPELIYLLLMLPFVAFIVSFSRYYIGLKSFGMYEPIAIAYSLYLISTDFWVGLRFGLPLIFLAWLVSEVFRRVFKGARLHYISKVSLKISIASILMLVVLSILSYFGKNGYFTVDPLPIIIILVLVESISLFKIKVGDLRTNLTSLETLVMSVVAYLLLAIPLTKNIVMAFPYVVILPILGSVFVGRWTGLRLSEYLRFKNVDKNE